jgi:hypothetical protein
VFRCMRCLNALQLSERPGVTAMAGYSEQAAVGNCLWPMHADVKAPRRGCVLCYGLRVLARVVEEGKMPPQEEVAVSTARLLNLKRR